MPVYVYDCEKGHRFERYLKMDDYKQPQTCECGSPGKRVFTPAMIINSFESYESPMDGSVISTPQKRRDDLARHGCIPYEPGMRQDADQRVKDDEVRLEKQVDETVDRLIHDMPSRKREKLEAELGSGVDINYTRLGSD